MIARHLGTAVLLLGLACSPWLLSAPAEAGDSGVQVSMSPTGPFRDQLHRQLFAGTGKLVPGDRVTRTFYVRNDSDVVARTTIAVSGSGQQNELADAIDVSVDLGAVSSAGSLETDDPSCTLTTTGANLAPGAVQAVEVALELDDVTGTRAAAQRASLDFLVTLTQVKTGVIETCGEQETGDREPEGDPGSDADLDDDRCEQGAVITVTGAPSCVPTAVDAGQARDRRPHHSIRDRVTRSAFPALLLLAVGGGLVIGAWPLTRRRSVEE
jgi:hypothetical protein